MWLPIPAANSRLLSLAEQPKVWCACQLQIPAFQSPGFQICSWDVLDIADHLDAFLLFLCWLPSQNPRAPSRLRHLSTHADEEGSQQEGGKSKRKRAAQSSKAGLRLGTAKAGAEQGELQPSRTTVNVAALVLTP